MKAAWGSRENSRPRGEGGKGGSRDACWESKRKKKKKHRHPVQMATRLIATVTHKQNNVCLRKCRQTTTRAQNTTTSHQPMLISTRPGFLSLAFIHSVSLKPAKDEHKRAHTHAHEPIFHPKIHEGKSLSSSPSHYFPSTLRGTVPSSVPALPLKSFSIFWQTIFPSLHSPPSFFFFLLASTQSGCASPLWHEIIYCNWDKPWENTCFVSFFSL